MDSELKKAYQLVYDDCINKINDRLMGKVYQKNSFQDIRQRRDYKDSWAVAGRIHRKVGIGNEMIHSALGLDKYTQPAITKD